MGMNLETPNMKAKWIERGYSAHMLPLCKGVIVDICWDSTVPKGTETGYKVTFLGRTLAKPFQHIEEAKKSGEEFARKVLNEALSQL
jgi:hypothetical protein